MNETLVTKLVVRNAVWIAFVGAVLFLTAGTARWAQAWVFLGELAAAGLAIGMWLAQHDPSLLRERMSPPLQQNQQPWDKKLVAALVVIWPAWVILMALDGGRYHWSQVPLWLQGAGAVMIALCMYVAYLTFRENSFAAPVVRIQSERGHRVVTTGPYSYVRHPMYAGALLFIFGTPLLLGSWIGLAATPLLAGMLAVRTVLEERTLTDELTGYREYAARVHYRLIPLIW